MPLQPSDPVARRLVVFGALILAALAGAAAAAPAPGHIAPFLLAFGAAFGIYAAAAAAVLRRTPADDRAARAALAVVVAGAVLFRLVFVFLPPAFSTDLYRYLWDGRVLRAGWNPYRSAPADPALAPLRDGDLFDRLEHRDVHTIYPPAAQLLFAAGSFAGLRGIKMLVVAADLFALMMLARLLRLRGDPPLRLLLYAWNPLVVVEVAWSGHLEPVGIACLLAGAAAIIQNRPVRGALAVAMAGLVKVLPWVLLIPLGRFLRPRAVAAAAALGLAAYWPFRGAGGALWSGLGAYAGRWEGNGAVFPIVQMGFEALDPAPALKSSIAFLRAHLPGSGPLDHLYAWVHPPILARAACAVLALAAAVGIARRVTDPLRALAFTIGAALLLSPTLHPWYLLWIAAFLPFYPWRAWILFTGLAALSYLNLGAAGGAPPHAWVPAAEYLPFVALLLGDAWRGWRARRVEPAVVPPGGGWYTP